MNVLDRTPCIRQRARILLERGTYNEGGLDRERAGQQMNQFSRAVADKDHVRIDTDLLRQFLSELPTIWIWIVHDLLERRANRTEHCCRRTQRIDAGAKIHDPLDRNSLFLSDLVDIPAVSGLGHPFTIRSHPMPNRTPVKLVQSMSI